jgi:glycosyltransferase involved in cell wall biosynthesis
MNTPHVPPVTVGLPVYNGERFLECAIDAILAQTHRDFLLIISDNASTDRTGEISQRYVERDPRVRYYRNPQNIGLSPNFNRVFELSKSPYFKWATSDDWVAPDMLRDALAVLESDPKVVLCYPKTTLIDETNGDTRTYDDQLNLMQDDAAERFIAFYKNIGLSHQHQGVLRADAIRRTRMLASHFGSDINFLAELTLYGKFYEVPHYQFFRRFHPDSSSWDRGSDVHQLRRYHAAGKKRIRFSVWNKYLAYARAIWRSPLTLAQKRRLFNLVGHHAYWEKGELCRELVRDGLP